MKRSLFFITGTDTAVGKTVLASLLTQYLHKNGLLVAALKPLCSGDRGDAEALRAAQGNLLSLDEINPWHFRAPLSPLIAARKMHVKVTLADVIAHVGKIQKRFPHVIVEGAGGLLSPLGENFDSRDLVVKLGAIPIAVCPNRLGAINQVRLVLAALPKRFSACAEIVLMAASHPDSSSTSNVKLLREFVEPRRVHTFPRITWQSRIPSRHAQAALKTLRTNLFAGH